MYVKSPKRTKCKSGIEGWTCKLQENYANFEEFASACEDYSIHTRLGYTDVDEAWEQNPIIRGSVNPSDLEVVPQHVFA